MRHLFRTIPLHFFCDEANGEYGLAHQNSIDRGFNAFYDGLGIFHDVFEHWFEHNHKYFLGDAGFNIGGEMAAMGAAWYYYDELSVHNRKFSDYHPFAETIRAATEDMIVDLVKHDGYWGFGDELVCNVPYQRPTDNCELEYQVEKLYETIKSTLIYDGEEENSQRCKAYKDSVTFQKIANLYRFGYRMAQRSVENTNDNRFTLTEFISRWDTFCALNSAEEMARVHRGIIFRLYKENGTVSWSARFERLPEFTVEDRRYLRVPLLTSETEIIHSYAA